MPAAILVPAIIGAAGVGAQVTGSVLQSKGANKAAKTQADAATEALNWEKERYGNAQTRLQPFRDMGNASMNAIAGRLGLPSTSAAPASPAAGITLRQMQTQNRGQGAPGVLRTAMQSGVVIQAPDGSRKRVPRALAAKYIQRGGQLIEGV